MNIKTKSRSNNEGFFTAITLGFILLLIGVIFIITPNLFDEIVGLIKDFSIVNVPNTGISFIGPENPLAHTIVYEAFLKFSIALAVFQFMILGLRFVTPSSWGKRSEAIGNFVSTAGSVYLAQLFLIENTQWFVFWSAIIIVIGVSFIARAAVMAISRS